jgi:hypothetical protein
MTFGTRFHLLKPTRLARTANGCWLSASQRSRPFEIRNVTRRGVRSQLCSYGYGRKPKIELGSVGNLLAPPQ